MADTTTLATVEFHGTHLVTTIVDGEPHVAMRPICEAVGLVWNGQYERLMRHPVLASVVRMTRTTGGDGKQYEMATLPLKMLNGWLFGVDSSRVKPEAQENLLHYQRECFDVLADYWQKGSAINPRAAQPALVGKATGLPLAQLQGLQDQSWKLITRLKGETQRVADDSKLRYTSACSKEHGIDVLNGAVMNRLACESKGGFFTSDAPLRRPGRMEPKGSPVLHRYVNFRFGLPPSLTWGMAVTQTVTGA